MNTYALVQFKLKAYFKPKFCVLFCYHVVPLSIFIHKSLIRLFYKVTIVNKRIWAFTDEGIFYFFNSRKYILKF